MPIFFGKAQENLDRSTHPDLQRADDGTLELRDDLDLPVERRDFNRMAAEGGAQWQAFYAQVARRQAELPPDVQEAVAGLTYSGGDAYENYSNYLADIGRLRTPIGADGPDLTGADVERMDLATYDRYFDETGRPRPGTTFHASSRDVDVRGTGMDRFSERELRNR